MGLGLSMGVEGQPAGCGRHASAGRRLVYPWMRLALPPAHGTAVPQRQLEFPSTSATGPLQPGAPLPDPATSCVPRRTSGLAADATLRLDDDSLDMGVGGQDPGRDGVLCV